MRARGLVAALGVVAFGCGSSVESAAPDVPAAEVSVVDTPVAPDVGRDVAAVDAGVADAGPLDVGIEDVSAPDVGARDDAAELDAGPPDVTSLDVSVADVAVVEAGAVDAGRDAAVTDVPAGRADPPAPRAYSRGACPTLRTGPTSDSGLNTGFRTGSQTRQFRVIVPRSYDGSEAWPVLFAWHWLNASSGSFVRTGEIESAAEEMRFIAVLPDGLSSYVFDWPFAEVWGVPGELTFFDDMLSCVSQQLRVDPRRVYGAGVSAGALWLTYLTTTDRADYFAAVNVMSGGLGEVPFAWRMEYAPQRNKFPALVLWGGPSDWLGLSFSDASMRYRDALLADHHFVVQCVHGSGHAVPPVDPPADGGTRFRPLWRFLLDHPYGSTPGTSPYFTSGLPAGMPSWCSIASTPPAMP
ncbi:MAG: PHB depolymerase family esterase [Polyangiales bacterium]